jgi:hypothetical protein
MCWSETTHKAREESETETLRVKQQRYETKGRKRGVLNWSKGLTEREREAKGVMRERDMDVFKRWDQRRRKPDRKK